MVKGIKQRKICNLCDSSNLELAIDLGVTALANAYLTKEQVNQIESGQIKEFKAPLRYFLCEDCGNFQIGECVNPKILFSNYLYASSTSGNLKSHFKQYADYLIDEFNLGPDSLVIEPASNDGVMLQSFADRGINFLGIEPAENLSKIANNKCLFTINDFFSEKLAKDILPINGQCDILTSNNSMAHLLDIQDFIGGVKVLLKKDGVFCFENSHLLSVIKHNYFDILYHEHQNEFSVHALDKFFKSKGMEIFDVKLTQPHGGSIRVFVQHKNGPHLINPNVQEIICQERDSGLFNIQTYKWFYQNLLRIKEEVKHFLTKRNELGDRIAAYSYPAKANTLCSFFEIGQLFEYVVEDSKIKQGFFTPEFHKFIDCPEFMYEYPPEIMVILAWNFSDMIVERNKHFKGEWFVPLPLPRIL